MNYSNIPSYQKWIERSFPEDFSENPEQYLGPNYEAVLNFYALYWGNTLKVNRKITDIADRNYTYKNLLRQLVRLVIPEHIVGLLPYPLIAYEIITMHLLLERGETLKFIRLVTSKNESN